MAQRGRKTTLEERVETSERWKAGETDSEVAAAMNRSVWTVPCTGRTGQCPVLAVQDSAQVATEVPARGASRAVFPDRKTCQRCIGQLSS